MATSKLQAILFDLDGTISVSDHLHHEAYRRVLKDYGIDCTHEFYSTQMWGRSNAGLLRNILPHLSTAEHEKIANRKESIFREIAQQSLQPAPGLLDLLAFLRKHNIKTAVVTNAPRANVEAMMRGMHLTDAFDTWVIGDDLPESKPAPLPYLIAVERLGVCKERCLAFEDSDSGIISAVRAGIETVAMGSPQMSAGKQRGLGARHVIRDFTELDHERLLAMRGYVKGRARL